MAQPHSTMISLEIRTRRAAEVATARAETQLKADLAELSLVEAQVSQLQQRHGVSTSKRPEQQRQKKQAWTEDESVVRNRTEAEKLRKDARLEREARRQRECQRIVERRRRLAGAFVANLVEGRERWVCGDTAAAVFLLEEALAQYKAGLFSDRPAVTDFPGSEHVAGDADDMGMLALVCALLGLSLAAEPTIQRSGHAHSDLDFDRIKRESRTGSFGPLQRTKFTRKNTTFHKEPHTDPPSIAPPGVSELQHACLLSPRVFGGAAWLAPSADHSVIDMIYDFALQWVRVLQRLSFAKVCYISALRDVVDCDTVTGVVERLTRLQPPRQSGVTRTIRRRLRSMILVKPNLDDEAMRRQVLQTPLGSKLPTHVVPTDALAAAMRLTSACVARKAK